VTAAAPDRESKDRGGKDKQHLESRSDAVVTVSGWTEAGDGQVREFRHPITVNLMSVVIGSAFVLFVFLITRRSLADFFSVMIALAMSATAMCYVFVFLALVVLRRKYPHAPRPYRVPGGMAGAWAAALITELFVVVTAITLLWPGTINSLFGESYSIESSWRVSRGRLRVCDPGRIRSHGPARAGVLGGGRRGLTEEAEFYPGRDTFGGPAPGVAILLAGPGAAVACFGRGNGQRAPRRCPP
jgi:amino acid transporter